jgi:hypothetical protein
VLWFDWKGAKGGISEGTRNILLQLQT